MARGGRASGRASNYVESSYTSTSFIDGNHLACSVLPHVDSLQDVVHHRRVARRKIPVYPSVAMTTLRFAAVLLRKSQGRECKPELPEVNVRIYGDHVNFVTVSSGS
jgi:hypothetical protein